MLFYDAHGNPLKGKRAGETWPDPLAAGRHQEALPRGRGGDGSGEESEPEESGAEGPKGWTVYNCYDER